MGTKNDKYVLLYNKIIALGITDKEKIDELIEQITDFANTLIDIYLQQNGS